MTFHPHSWMHFFAERCVPSLLINEIPLIAINLVKIWGQQVLQRLKASQLISYGFISEFL